MDAVKLSPADARKIMEARSLLMSCPDKRYTVRQLARTLLTNESKLKQGFRMLFGESIGVYSKEVRMSRARDLLLNTSDSLQDIAEATGYTEQQNFSIAFKKYHKISPQLFRQQHILLEYYRSE